MGSENRLNYTKSLVDYHFPPETAIFGFTPFSGHIPIKIPTNLDEIPSNKTKKFSLNL
jgi:hypothetical protein